jgi:hypothetical protein
MIRTLALSLFVGYTTTPLRRTSGLVLTRNPDIIGLWKSSRQSGQNRRIVCNVFTRAIMARSDGPYPWHETWPL